MASKDEQAMDELAERVSAHGSLARAAKAMGISRFRADWLWFQILGRLGEQAR